MLTEFLLTPDAIVDPDGRDGSDAIRDLKSCLFPFNAAPTALVCRLGDTDWTRAVSSRIARIVNTNHRQLAMSLMTQLVEQLSVKRPASHRNNEDESGWIESAVRSSRQLPLGRIIVSGQSTPPPIVGTSLKQFLAPAFWENLSNPRAVGRDTATQDEVLRAICTHSDWLLLRLPQIRGGSDDEIVTVKQIVKLSNRLPVGFQKSDIDLHVCLMRDIPEQNLIRGIEAQLNVFVRQGMNIKLTVWPERHFVNREIIGGDYAETSQRVRVPRPLWWITMTHVAVGGINSTNAGDGGNTWGLFPRHKAHERFEKIGADKPHKVVTLR